MAFRLGKRGVLLAVLTGVMLGVGAYTFQFAQGFSYMGNDPRTCANCHIMWPQYDSWNRASHHATATCGDCHLPQSLIPKYLAKASNGWHHSKAFTLQNFHEPIMIHEDNAKILQANCLRCHGAYVDNILGATDPDAVQCVHCHQSVGHGPRK